MNVFFVNNVKFPEKVLGLTRRNYAYTALIISLQLTSPVITVDLRGTNIAESTLSKSVT